MEQEERSQRHTRKRRMRARRTLSLAVRGSNPDPAEAKLTPVMSSSTLSVGSKYGGIVSFNPTYSAKQSQTKATSS